MEVFESLTYTAETSTSDLVLGTQNGDRRAFSLLVERFERAVYATAMRRLGNHADAQELCQDVFIQVLRKIGQLREPACFAGWLRSVTSRMALNRAMRRDPAVAVEPDAISGQCLETETPLDSALTGERRRQVRAGLKRLRTLDRQTLVAFYVDGRSIVEMSDKFRSPVGTIKRRLHVARKRLAKELHELVTA